MSSSNGASSAILNLLGLLAGLLGTILPGSPAPALPPVLLVASVAASVPSVDALSGETTGGSGGGRGLPGASTTSAPPALGASLLLPNALPVSPVRALPAKSLKAVLSSSPLPPTPIMNLSTFVLGANSLSKLLEGWTMMFAAVSAVISTPWSRGVPGDGGTTTGTLLPLFLMERLFPRTPREPSVPVSCDRSVPVERDRLVSSATSP
mmetsp:Transcript_46217/g.98049  ORF Transcript_46217/g.98049 Transcript_46217/m.98049 type:complete len:208 (-) Transcript_46217:1143-1766(-)